MKYATRPEALAMRVAGPQLDDDACPYRRTAGRVGVPCGAQKGTTGARCRTAGFKPYTKLKRVFERGL